MKNGDLNPSQQVIAPGARIEVRDAEWLVRRVDRTYSGGDAVHVIGISEIVQDKEAISLTGIDTGIKILNPAETGLEQDRSAGYQASRLYLESLLRKKPPPVGEAAEAAVGVLPSLFEDDFATVKTAIGHLRRKGPIEAQFHDQEKSVDLTMTRDLKRRLKFLREIWPDDGLFILTADSLFDRYRTYLKTNAGGQSPQGK